MVLDAGGRARPPTLEDPWLQERAAHRAREALCPTPCAHTRLHTAAHTYTHTPLCTYNSTSPAHTVLMPLHTSAPCTSLLLRSLCLSSSKSSPVGPWFAGCCPGASARSLLGYVSLHRRGCHIPFLGGGALSRLPPWGEVLSLQAPPLGGRCSLSRLHQGHAQCDRGAATISV